MPRIGVRKLHRLLLEVLATHQIKMGRDKLSNFLYDNQLINKPKPKTTIPCTNPYPDLLKGNLITNINQVWVTDITYFNLSKGFVFLALVTDLCSRMIIGYCVSTSLRTEDICLPALEMALTNVPVQHRPNLTHHSYRGTQYLSSQYCNRLSEEHIKISVTQTGNPYDNAIAERLNGILKQELLPKCFANISQAKQAIGKAIAVYNTTRPHNGLKSSTPKDEYHPLKNHQNQSKAQPQQEKSEQKTQDLAQYLNHNVKL